MLYPFIEENIGNQKAIMYMEDILKEKLEKKN